MWGLLFTIQLARLRYGCDFDDDFANLVLADEWCVCVFREKQAEAASRGGNPAAWRITEKLDIVIGTIVSHGFMAFAHRLPTHFVNALQYQLDIDVFAMAFQSSHAPASTCCRLGNCEYIFPLNRVLPGRQFQQVGAAQKIKSDRKQRMQGKVAFGVGECIENHGEDWVEILIKWIDSTAD